MSFVDKKGIVVASGFKLQAEVLLDARQQVDTIEERNELVTIHAATAGLRVFVKETGKSYVYNGTTWQELTVGAAYRHPTGDGNHHVPATGTSNNGKVLMAGSTAGSESWQKLTKSDISDFPTSLPNPAALTISLNGTSQGAYNGSSAKNINITPDSIGASEDGHTHNYAGSSTVGGAANSVKTSLIVKLNSGTTEGTNMFTFNGSTAKTVNITASSIGAATSGHTHTHDKITDFDDAVEALIPSSLPTANSLVVKLNGGTKEGTNMFTFNGSAAKSINITPAAIGAAASSHNHSAANITSGTLAIARGGTGLTASPSMLVNLGSDDAANVFTASPRPGVTGTLPIANGGTGATSAAAARTALGITPANIGAATTSHNHTTDDITDFEEAVNGLIPSIPSKLPNPQALTFTGAVSATYDGSTAKTINIPTSGATDEDLIIKLNGGTTEGTNMFTFDGGTAKTVNITPSSIGAATSSHTHTHDKITDFDDAVEALLPSIPTSLPNPAALTISLNGTSQGAYTGSTAKSINITPSSIGAAASSHSHSLASTGAAGYLRQLNGSTSQFMRGDGTWATPPNTTYSAMTGASSSAAGKAGLVPAPAAGAANRYLRSDGTWSVPPDTNTTYTLSSFGITATAAEINKLDGVTVTKDEINFLDGVTANVQTQLNGKASSSHTHNYAGSSSAGGAANSVKSSLIVKLNGGTKEGTNMFTFNGSAAKTVNITASSIGAATSGHTHTHDKITDFEEAVNGLLPSIPSKLPNPQALTFTGAVSATYDGSAAKTINIPTSGATDEDLIIKLNGGSTEGTNMFTFDGGTSKTVNITPSSIGAAASSHSHSLASTGASGFLRQLSGSTSQFMRGDGTWATPPNTTYSSMTGASSSAAGKAGLVPAPAAGAANRYLRSDGTWAVPPDTNTTYSNMTGASSSTGGKAGLVPAPAAGAANRYLRSDGTWQVPPDTKTTLSSLGITATASEINKLDGVTATKDEINFLDGVTSNIQTQLNGKASSSHTHNYAGSSSAGGAANSVKTSLIVKLNSGSTEGTNMFTFNGSAAKTINITPSSIGAAAASHGTHVSYSTSAPLAAGTASAGSASTVARSDHRHPLQTTVSGNAGTATKLATARTISLTGDATGSASFDGSANASIPVSVKNHAYTDIPSNSNLNSYTDPGWYRCTSDATAATISNSPTVKAFVMIVNAHAGTNQIVIEYMTSAFHIWTRNYVNNVWGSWAEIYTTIQKPTASEIGAAASSHNHAASNITSGTLAVARGGTGITSNPSMLVNLGSTSAASVFTASPRPGVTGTLPISRGGTGATTAAAARTALGAAASNHTHNYAGSSSAGGAATSANKVNVPVGTILFSTSSSSTFFSSCFGGTWTVVGNVDAIVGGSSTLTLYMFRKTAS